MLRVVEDNFWSFMYWRIKEFFIVYRFEEIGSVLVSPWIKFEEFYDSLSWF